MESNRHLQHVDFSHCYCLTTDAIRPLLNMPPGQLKTLILYGCGQIDRRALVYLIHRHSSSLTCIGLTDINDQIMYAIQQCRQLKNLGLEHCSDTDLTEDAITQFFNIMKAKNMRLQQLRVRDIQSLTTEHVCELAHTCADTLSHLDMSECVRVSHSAFLDLAVHCTRLETFSIGYQAEVTNLAISVRNGGWYYYFGKKVGVLNWVGSADLLCLFVDPIYFYFTEIIAKLFAPEEPWCGRMFQLVQWCFSANSRWWIALFSHTGNSQHHQSGNWDTSRYRYHTAQSTSSHQRNHSWRCIRLIRGEQNRYTRQCSQAVLNQFRLWWPVALRHVLCRRWTMPHHTKIFAYMTHSRPIPSYAPHSTDILQKMNASYKTNTMVLFLLEG